MGVAEQQCHLHCLILHTLVGLANVDAQLAQLAHMVLIDELDLSPVCDVENNSHDGLAGSDWAVYLCMDLVDTD